MSGKYLGLNGLKSSNLPRTCPDSQFGVLAALVQFDGRLCALAQNGCKKKSSRVLQRDGLVLPLCE